MELAALIGQGTAPPREGQHHRRVPGVAGAQNQIIAGLPQKHHAVSCGKAEGKAAALQSGVSCAELPQTAEKVHQLGIFPAPRIYVLKTFGLIEGEAVRLMNPDGTNFPW